MFHSASLEKLHIREAGVVCECVVLTGGNTKFPNLLERFRSDLQPYLPSYSACHVSLASDPVLDAWTGASRFALAATENPDLYSQSYATKAEYEEYGHYYCNEKLNKSWCD